jgi:hypothetical protein
MYQNDHTSAQESKVEARLQLNIYHVLTIILVFESQSSLVHNAGGHPLRFLKPTEQVK